MKRLALLVAIMMLGLVAYKLFVQSEAVTIIVNGKVLKDPIKGIAGAWGTIVALIAFFCALIFLAFVFVGVGLFVLGIFMLAALGYVIVFFPFLLPIFIPLTILWLFIVLSEKLK